MKTSFRLASLALAFFVSSCFGQAPPLLRNTYTTNADPIINQIVINIASNAAWNMGDAVSNMVWQIGQNDTNHDWSIGLACSNLAWKIGTDLTNYAGSLVGGTNTVLASNFFAMYATITNLAAIYSTNQYIYVSNVFAPWIFVNNLYATNATNQTLSVSNMNAQWAFIENLMATNSTNINLIASNLITQWIFVHNLIATNATNFFLVASNAYRMDTNLNDFAGNEYVTADYVATVLTRETQLYFRASITNTATNACYLLSTTFNPTNTTNTSYLMTNNLYAATFLATNQQVTAIADGNAVVDFDADVTSGTATIRPELYLTTNGVTDVEFAEGGQVALTTTRNHFRTLISIPTNIVVQTRELLKVAFKTLALTGSPRLRIYTGSNAVSGITLPGIPQVQPRYAITFALATNETSSSLTNHIADFNRQYSVIFATNDLNFIHSTNRLPGFWQSAVLKIYTGPTNRQCWFNSSWVPIGSATTNYSVLASNKVAILSLGQDGDQETNVCAVLVVQP